MNSQKIYLGLHEWEHSEMDLYNNEMGRRIAVDSIEKGENTVDILAGLILDYANSEDAYFRFVTKDETKEIDATRPQNFKQVFSDLGLMD